MTAPVVYQTPPTFDRCAGLMDGVCVLQETVEQFLNSRQYQNAGLADLIPCDFEFVIGNAETTIPSEIATPEITLRRSDIQLANVSPRNLNDFGSTVTQPTFSLEFEIKTAYYKLSELLTLELGQFLITFAPYMRQYNMTLASVTCGRVQRNRETTPNYYFSKVTVNASLPMIAWRYPVIGDILRSISLNVNIRGGSATAAVELT